MGASGSKVAAGVSVAYGVATALQAVSAAATAAACAPLALGVTAAVAIGAAAGLSYNETPAAAAPGSTTPWSTGFHEGNKAARDAIGAVFEAVTKAQEAASSYVYAISSAAAWAASRAYEKVKQAVSKAYEKVKQAAANVKRCVVGLIQRLYGGVAAALGKTKLDGVKGLIGAGDVSSLVDSTVEAITGVASSAIVPARSSGPLVVLESGASKLARSSADDMLSLLDSIPSVEEKAGFEIPTTAKVAIDRLHCC